MGEGLSGYSRFKDGSYPKDLLHSIFFSMLRIRLIEEKIEADYHKDRMKTPIHLVIGQEAITVGVCAALNKTDLVHATHRTHGTYLAKGGNLRAMIAEMFCKTTGCVGSRGGSMHLLDQSVGMAGSSAIVGGAVPIATGMALTAKMKKADWISTVFFGDAATEEGAVWESINFAALKKLPVIYVCENNFYSVCSPLTNRQPPNVEIYKKAESFGVAAVQLDGTNVLEVYEAAVEAVKRARLGSGSTFIEAKAYRWRAHGGAGDDSHTGYRDPEEVKLWQQVCPVETFFQFLKEIHVIDGKERQAMAKEISEEIEDAFAFAERSPLPTETDLSLHLYSP
jgi:pyruvate dehydrogenase E1 component alpha subunit